MQTYLVYFDESGDDGLINRSSDTFILTSIYLDSNTWQKNFDKIKEFRKDLKEQYGFPIKQEMHTKYFLSDKDPYRKFGWSKETKLDILKNFTLMISSLDIKCINVIIDKTKINIPNYNILSNSLKYNIQRIDNDSNRKWNYIIITDKGRISPMRKTAREIRAFNPIQSKYSHNFKNQPISGLIEDILEKESSESYFIQICDFISYFIHLYYKCCIKKKKLPTRIGNLIDTNFIKRVMATFKESGILNLKANSKSAFGLVIYPK